MKKTCICIICPNGCEIETEVKEDGTLSLTGNTCDKGADYVRQELTAPVRTISTSVHVKGGVLPLASVRLTRPVPKEMIFPVMEQIRKISLTAPVQSGTVILRKVCGLDSDVVATRTVRAVNESQSL